MEPHLNSSQIEELLLLASAGNEQGVVDRGNENARTHLNTCQVCQETFRAEQEAMGRFAQLRIDTAGARGPQCPPETVWLEVAAGSTTGGLEDYLSHAAECDHCGPLLRGAVADFADELTSSEEAQVVNLRSSTPEWRNSLVAKLVSREQPRESGLLKNPRGDSSASVLALREPWFRPLFTGFSPQMRWAGAACFALLLIAATIVWHREVDSVERREPISVADVNRMLAQAYSERRTFELRIPGAALGSTYRGGEARADRPQSLNEAEDEIGKHLGKSPSDLVWLQAKGRADLLDGNYEAAIARLQRVLNVDPELTEARTDQATAYYLRGQKETKEDDFASAYKLLTQVLAQKPNDLVALFNRAIVEEDLHSYTDAKEDWKRYLQLDPLSPWANEARKHLSNLEKSNTGERDRVVGPLEVSRGSIADSTIDRRVESYLDAALTSWLPLAFSPAGQVTAPESSAARQALHVLASLLADSHRDRWLRDLLTSGTTDPQFRQAVLWMAESHQANARGEYARAIQSATRASAHFGRAGNRAGWLFSQWEMLYATRLSYRAEECSGFSRGLWARLQDTSYYWLQARASLDYSQCAELSNRLQLASHLADRSSRISMDHGFPDLYLRAAKVSGDLALLTAEPAKALALYERGLDRFWTSDVGYMAGYNLYSGLDDEAEFLGLWDLDASVLREALALAARDPDLGMRAVMHERLAAALLMSGDADGARQHVEEASHLFASLPQDESVRGKLAEVGILTARLSLLHGQPTQALKRLSAVRSEVQRLGNSDISFEFLCTAGLAAEALGQAGEAHEDLEGAIALAESGLQTITTEHQRLLWSRRCSPAYRGMVHLELSRNPEAAFAWWEWYRGASRRSSLQSRHLFRVSSVYRDLQDAGRLLGQNSIVLSYAVFPEGIAAWTYDGTGVQYRWIAISATMVSRESLRFASLCSDPGSDLGALRQTGLELYEVLINSIKPILQQHTHAMIEADGDLDRIPFDALVDREGNYLADTFTFGYSTGVLYLNGSAPLHNFSADSRALVVADPTAHPELGLLSLPDAELEARTVARDFPRASLLVGGQATRGELERKLATAKVLHFAGHAVVSGNGSALVLYKPPGDGNGPSLFGAVDFNQSSLHRTALVVLSACSTAQGPDGGFNESESLARSLVSSGIPQVIASRWPVESAASSALMKEFYSDLVAGQSTVESLRTSEGHLRAQEDFKHPFYWAAFSLFGKI